MVKRNNGDKASSKQKSSVSPEIDLLDAKEFLFQHEGQTYNVEDAPDEVFDAFIRLHITMGWSLEDRVDAINLALKEGKTLAVTQEKNQAENQIAI